LLLVYDLRHLLTQTFWKVAEAGAPGIPDVTANDIMSDLEMLNDMEMGLAFGSVRFRVDAPSDVDQIALSFENMCAMVSVTNCTMFANGLLTHGLHAGMLEFVNQARNSFSVVNITVDVSPFLHMFTVDAE
jgi:hypothetical protein